MAKLTLQNESTVATPVDRSAWDAALANYRRVDALFDLAVERHAAAESAVEDACPRVARYFDEYQLGMGMNRARVVETLEWQRCSDSEALADEFMAYQQRSNEAEARFRVAELDAKIDELRAPYEEAREALMALPAPDHAGLLAKFEIAAVSLASGHAEAALADARRLLAESRL